MKEYINTEFEELPSDWNLLEIESVIKNEKKTIDPAKNPEELFEYYSIPAYQDKEKPYEEIGKNIRSQKLLITKDTILFGKLNPRVPKIWLVDDGSRHRQIASTEFIPLKPIPETVNSTFLYYLCWSKYILPKSRELVSGSTPSRQRVDHKAFKKIIIPHPPLDEQRNIAYILSTIQKAIEATDKIITATQKLKKSLMQHLFTYGPVSLEEAEQVPLKETEVGRIPAHWKVSLLKGITLISSQFDPRNKPNEKFKYIDVSSVSNQTLRIEDYKTYVGKDAPSRARKVVHTNDVIFATVRPYLKRMALVPSIFNEEYCSTAFCIIRASKQWAFPEFLFYTVSTNWFVQKVSASQRGSSYPAVSDKDVLNQYIPLPPLLEQQMLFEQLINLDKKIQAEVYKKTTLQSLFNSMLHYLMTGKLRVKDLDLNIPEEVAQ